MEYEHLMPIYNLTLIQHEEITNATYTFTFEKPENFKFKAGQYGGFTLINPSETDQ
jgi:NAD(P)H-flavin reductase